ncbi:S9 family peptidase [Oceanobacillus chungangensis]|uniref:Oligopeptidase B n=1 Tax=Oceanobacillus chungangensis TaxID=1229152 RepID=A0A3D8PFV2_9BACI|nr:S9 family peptidase [Oceanobacillus chungangensis]RDW14953.1 oligopeptidase B [Oceanobacillus chungangensis]
MKPPTAKQIPYKHRIHGDIREDHYYWLKDRDNKDVINYLEEENQYYDHILEPLKEQTEEIFDSMVQRIPETEEKVPVQRGPYFYYSRLEKEKQYPIFARKIAANREQLDKAKEEIVLDVNELAHEDEYLNVTERRITADHRLLAYLENRDGSDRYTLYIKDLETGSLLEDQIPNVYLFGSIEWSRSGQYIFYIIMDENQRPYQLWRHRLSTSNTDDELIYEETDPTFTLFINTSQSGKFIFIQSHSTETTEFRLLDTDLPEDPPKLVDERKHGVIYDVEHWEDDLLILTNENALNFQLLRCPLDNPGLREPVINYDGKRFLQAVYPFRDALLIFGREKGMTQIWRFHDGKLEQFAWDEPIYTVSVVGNQSYTTTEVLIEYQSLLTPQTTFAVDLSSGNTQQLQVAPVSGNYELSSYRQKQVWTTAEDGVNIPMMMVYHKDAFLTGPAPLILEGYGSYGANNDPYFDPYSIPLLDKGIVFVTAHIRGGSEMGRSWYEDGKMQKKRNSFTDFIAAATYLIDEKYTTSSQLAARGGSAGGLLVGAVANMAGELFKVIVPEVPFVDVVTTMLDDTIPLTTLEWEEWGNPQKLEDYFYMKSYSPYDNVEEKKYPHMYVTAGLNDPRVGYFEPAKWVARLREKKTDDNTLVLKTNMGAGHFGASGRFNQLKEESAYLAFTLDKIVVD